jgi:GntR family transcriptional regulator, transcriptional repressor for pyruvate dehydrogenase complex
MSTSTPPANQERPKPALDEQIVADLVDGIVAGRFPAGRALPPERDLADQLGVNRTSLRQGLARLQQMGLVEARQGSGNVVRDPAELTDPTVVRAMAVRLDPSFFVELVELREGLGDVLGRLAAVRATTADRARLREALEAVVGAGDAAERQRAELAYFGVLVASTHNRALALLMRWVESAYGGAPRGFEAAFEDAGVVVTGLERITEAVCRRRPTAAGRTVSSYLHDSGMRLVDSLGR